MPAADAPVFDHDVVGSKGPDTDDMLRHFLPLAAERMDRDGVPVAHTMRRSEAVFLEQQLRLQGGASSTPSLGPFIDELHVVAQEGASDPALPEGLGEEPRVPFAAA